MSTSRRKFLKAGMLAAIFATVPLRNVPGQSWKDRDGNPGEFPGAQSDPLSTYTKETFKSYLNSIFQLHTVFGIAEVTLSEVDDFPSARGGECFSLLFRGGSRPLRQDNYVLVHPALGRFSLLLVPTGSDRNGAQGYIATLNRLSYADLLNNPAPRRSGVELGPALPAATPAGTPVSPAPASEAPAVTAPSQPAAPATQSPKVITKPARKRKPSWKEIENEILEFLN